MTIVRIGAIFLLAGAVLASSQPPRSFRIEEATIAQLHAAMKSGRLTCASLRRIDRYDKQGPALNAITVINPDARKIAGELDLRMKRSGFAGPLHCVPVIVKDNFETAGLQTAAGSMQSACPATS